MKRFTLSAAGLAAAAICGASNADISVQFSSGALMGGQFIVIGLGSISGTLTSAIADIQFTNLTGDSSWAADMLVAVSDGNSNAGEFGGFNLSFGATDLGGWVPGSSSTSGFYSMLATNGGSVAMNGTNGAIYIANGYSGSSGASYSGKITLKGLNYVPAPGAVALIGLAGLRSRRRAR